MSKKDTALNLVQSRSGVEQPAQQEPQGLIRQSEEDFQRFLKTTNLKAINGRKTLAALAWRISHQQTKKRINQMKASQAFDDGGAQDLTILNVHSKNFLKELAVHAREACDVVVPEWAEKYGSLASAAEELVKMIERTEVVHE